MRALILVMMVIAAVMMVSGACQKRWGQSVAVRQRGSSTYWIGLGLLTAGLLEAVVFFLVL